jgi:hypothetical protein
MTTFTYAELSSLADRLVEQAHGRLAANGALCAEDRRLVLTMVAARLQPPSAPTDGGLAAIEQLDRRIAAEQADDRVRAAA